MSDVTVPIWKRVPWRMVLLDCALFPCAGIVALTVNSTGLALLFVMLATPLYKIPILGPLVLAKYKLFHEINIAPFVAIALLVATFLATTKSLTALLYGVSEKIINPELRLKITFTCAVVLILFDSMLFWRGLLEQSFMESGGKIMTTICTIAYSVTLAYGAFLHVCYKEGDEL